MKPNATKTVGTKTAEVVVDDAKVAAAIVKVTARYAEREAEAKKRLESAVARAAKCEQRVADLPTKRDAAILALRARNDPKCALQRKRDQLAKRLAKLEQDLKALA